MTEAPAILTALYRACAIALVALPSDSPGARLNEIVTTGNCPWWLMASRAGIVSKWLKVESGTCCPLTDFT